MEGIKLENHQRVLSLTTVDKQFKGKKIFDQLSVDFYGKSITGIVAPNGYGKSTLFELIMNFKQPDKGAISFFDGLSFQNSMNYQEIRRRVILLPEQFELHQELTGLQHLNMYRSLWSQEKQRVEVVIERLNLGTFIKKEVRTYSLGMRQRLCFAMQYVANGDLYLLDEPTNGLDSENIQGVTMMLQELKNEGKTILIISHDLNWLEGLADRFLFIKEYRIGYDYQKKWQSSEKFLRLTAKINQEGFSRGLDYLEEGKLYPKTTELYQDLYETNQSFTLTTKTLVDLFKELYPLK